MIRTEVYSSINAIDPVLWNSLVSVNHPFNTHEFIKSIEGAKVENADFWYLLFYKGNDLEGHAVLSVFDISLDLFISEQKIVRWIKNIRPSFFKVRILFNGLPVSLGQSNIEIKNKSFCKEIMDLMADKMNLISKEKNVSLLCSKEFKEQEATYMEGLFEHRFFKANSIPYMSLDVKWHSFEEYLENLRHPYRRAIRKSLKKVGFKGFWFGNEIKQDFNLFPEIIHSKEVVMDPKVMHESYMQLMDRAETKLETLNLAFFEEIRKNDDYEMIYMKFHDEIICWALLKIHGSNLTFTLMGRKNGQDPFDSYYNLIYAIIAYGIKKKVKTLFLGQTAYWVKQRVGGTPHPTFLYFKSKKPIVHFLLDKLKGLIFPVTILPKPQVFKGAFSVYNNSKLKNKRLPSYESSI